MGNDIRLATLVALLGSLSGAQAMQSVRENERPPMASVDAQTSQSLPAFSAIDRDADGVISEQEASSHPALAALFADLDKNHNGTVSIREYAEGKIQAER